jgi:hypothetical protein
MILNLKNTGTIKDLLGYWYFITRFLLKTIPSGKAKQDPLEQSLNLQASNKNILMSLYGILQCLAK